MIDKLNAALAPSKEDLVDIIRGPNNARLKSICSYIEEELNAKAHVDYSTCSAAPGWNFKYKKGGKSVCTVYPEKDDFIVLITLNFDALEKFNILAENFSPYLRDLAAKTAVFNGTKWLMVNVGSDEVCSDIKKLIGLKFGN